MAIYGLGEIMKGGVEGWAQGEEDQHKAERRPQELLQADLENEDRTLRNENARRVGDEYDTQLGKRDQFKAAYEKRMGEVLPDFGAEANHAWREYNAAVATGSPQLIQEHLKKYQDATNADLLGESGRLVNQAMNSQGAASDFGRINSMFRTRKMQLQIIRSDPDGFVVEGPNGLKKYTHQGFLTEMNQALNPNVVYGNVQAQLSNQEAQRNAEKNALAERAEKIRLEQEKRTAEEITYGRKKTDEEAEARRKAKEAMELQESRNKSSLETAKIRAVPRASAAAAKAPVAGSPEAKAQTLANQLAITKIYESMRRSGRKIDDVMIDMRKMGYTKQQIAEAIKSGK